MIQYKKQGLDILSLFFSMKKKFFLSDYGILCIIKHTFFLAA